MKVATTVLGTGLAAIARASLATSASTAGSAGVGSILAAAAEAGTAAGVSTAAGTGTAAFLLPLWPIVACVGVVVVGGVVVYAIHKERDVTVGCEVPLAKGGIRIT